MRWLKLTARTKMLRAIREAFWNWGFVEADTPLLVARPGQEPYLEPMSVTVKEVSGKQHAGFLITSPEYALKKLLAKAASGEAPEFAKVFQLAHVFRNAEDFGGTHNPEFTMLEWYRLDADYNDLMNDVEELVCRLVGAPELIYQGRTIDLTRPWPRLTVAAAFKKFAGREDVALLAQNTADFFKVFLHDVEPKIRELNTPVHLVDYPVALAALAKKKDGQPVAERVETYIAGLELTNGWSELTDAAEQRERFLREQAERRANQRPVFPWDEEFLLALSQIKKAAGMSLGVDRLLMLLLDCRDINEVLFWPAKDLFNE